MRVRWSLVGKLFAVGFLAAIVAVVLAWPVLLGHLRAALLLDRLSGQRVTRLQTLVGGPVQSSSVSIPGPSPLHGHLFVRAKGRIGPGVLVVHGFSPVGDNYDALAATAESLAGSGFTVFTPTITPLTRCIVDKEDIEMIGRSAQWLAQKTGGPVTVIGISFSGGMTLVAAVQPQFRSSFRQIITLAGYDDLYRISRFYLTGIEPLPGGGEMHEPPDASSLDVAALHFISFLVPPEDVDPVRSAIGNLLADNALLRTNSADLAQGLTLNQQQEMQWITSGGPELRARVANLIEQQRAALAPLSPHGQMARLRAPVTVITGVHDPAIPSPESEWIAHDLPPGTLCKLYLSPLLTHVSFATPHREAGLQRLRRWMSKLVLIHKLAPAMETADPHSAAGGCHVPSVG